MTTDDAVTALTAQLARELDHARRTAGVTLAVLAQRLGVTEGRVCQMLDGKGNPTLQTLVRLADALNADVKITFQPRTGGVMADDTAINIGELWEHRVSRRVVRVLALGAANGVIVVQYTDNPATKTIPWARDRFLSRFHQVRA